MFLNDKPQGEVKELDEGSALLLCAAELLEKKGHCNWAAQGFDGSLCVHAALMEVAGAPHDAPALVAARYKLAQHLDGGNITYWSNASTQKQVLAMLRAVALSG